MAASSLLSFTPRPLPLLPSKSHLLSPLPFQARQYLTFFPSSTSYCSFIPHSNNNNSTPSIDPPDRILSAACYLYPFLDGVQYGRFVLSQFPLLQVPLRPIAPLLHLFHASPLTPILLFLTLYFAVVRNPSSFSRYVRFNTMQAIALDVLLIFPDLLDRSFVPRDGVGMGLVQSLDSTVFFFLLISLVYGSTSCLLGQVPRLPFVADAADRQVM
jgi:hypothetical protein